MFLPKVTYIAPLARLVSSIATSAGAGLLVMAIFSHDRRQRWQIYNLTYIVKLSRYADKSRPHSRQYPLMQSSTTFGFSVIFLLCASCPGCPPRFKAALLSQGFCAPNHFGFHLSLEGGVLLLFEFLSGFSYFSSRLRRLRFSFEAFPRYGANSHSPYVAHRWLHASTASQMSAFSRLAIYP